jgi:hypothetical protein
MPEWNAANVWVASERFPGTCSRCGQPSAAHFAIERYCFEPPSKEIAGWDKARALAKAAFRPASLAAEFGVPVEQIIDALAKALLPFADANAVNFALDRAETWRTIGIDPEQAERDNCWLAPSVASYLDWLEKIKAATIVYRDAVLRKRALDSKACPRAEYQTAIDAKRAAGETLFALLPRGADAADADSLFHIAVDKGVIGDLANSLINASAFGIGASIGKRAVEARDARPCPKCGAAVGEWCKNNSDNPGWKSIHRERL